MTELHAILNTWRSIESAHRDAVLATVVHVAGSVYRRPGARLLLIPDGRRVGSVSGGCLEGEIARKAWYWTEANRPSLQVFDTTSEDDAIWGFGLGCNGVVQVLVERVSTPGAVQLLEFLEIGQSFREEIAVATVVRSSQDSETRVGQRLLVNHREAKGELAASKLFTDISTRAVSVISDRKSQFVHLESVDLFIEYVPPCPSLVILGAGFDANALVTIAKEVGFHVTVADSRLKYLRRDYFPDADKVILLTNDDVAPSVPISPETAVVLMTHNYDLDRRLLPAILAARPRYLGLLGPRARAERLFADLGTAMPSYVHAPIGLDIGGDSPAFVALSVAAEIQAVFEGRSGKMLKYRCGAIHQSIPETEVPSGMWPRESYPFVCDSEIRSDV
jgi:xanthine dehydrogenase accessory factor